MKIPISIFLLILLNASSVAYATETITYTYDALGRLVRVVHQSGPADGVTVDYSHDQADNRTNVTVTGAQ